MGSSWWTVLATGPVRPSSSVGCSEKQQSTAENKLEMHLYEENPQSEVVLRRQNKTILETRFSIPRVSIYKCDNCDQRITRRSSSHNEYARRPHSVHLEQDNYLYLQQIDEVEFQKFYRKLSQENQKIKKLRP